MLSVRPNGPRGILLTGGTGYLGGLVAATLLTQDDVTLLVPLRAQYDADGFWGPVQAEIVARTGHFEPSWRERVHIVDRSLAAAEEIVFDAGSHSDAVKVKYEDFARAVIAK